MSLLKWLELKSEKWWLKEKLKPLYRPLLASIQYKSANKNFLKQGDNVLHAACRVLNEAGVFHWLEFGTLLGVVRDGRLIAHDTDIDFGVFIEDRSERIARAFQKAGFTLEHRFEIEDGNYGLEESYVMNGVSVDLFYFTRTDSGMFCHLFPVVNKNERQIRELHTAVNTFKKIEWQGVEVHIPEDSDRRLRDTYGDYQIPVKDWYTPTQALNSAIIDKAYKECKP
jgi:hypothetical protein